MSFVLMDDEKPTQDQSEDLQKWLKYRDKGRSYAVQSCSFCGRDREDWIRMITTDEVGICEECVELCVEAFAENTTLRCGFCGKTSDQVEKLITGKPSHAICDACVALCDELILEKRSNKDS